MKTNRRNFIRTVAAGVASAAVIPAYSIPLTMVKKDLFFKISLAQWSLHKALFNGEIDNLEFPSITADKFGLDGVEYVNQFFPSSSTKYAKELLKRSDDAGVNNVLIMIDGEGDLGGLYSPVRNRAVEKHFEWIECAKTLGCHSIRVNARGDGPEEAVADAASDGLRKLSEFGAQNKINVIVENHGGYSSDAQWLTKVISNVNMDNCGTLPDFGNFVISRGNEYDRYKGTKELMEFAKGVSAKSHDFDEDGNEIHTDYARMLKIVKESGYSGYIGIEYEGSKLSEPDGILATKKLLLKAGAAL